MITAAVLWNTRDEGEDSLDFAKLWKRHNMSGERKSSESPKNSNESTDKNNEIEVAIALSDSDDVKKLQIQINKSFLQFPFLMLQEADRQKRKQERDMAEQRPVPRTNSLVPPPGDESINDQELSTAANYDSNESKQSTLSFNAGYSDESFQVEPPELGDTGSLMSGIVPLVKKLQFFIDDERH